MTDKMYDVIQIGYGPVSQSLALMLGRQGWSVATFERWRTPYPLPRAVCIDHEIYRVLSANGMGDVLPTVSHKAPRYQWFNAEWRELLAIDWAADSISGGAEVNFVHQPTLERALSAEVSRQSTVKMFFGWEAIKVEQTDTACQVTLRNELGEIRNASSRYVVGCDGANSMVRAAIGGTQEDRGFQADWLVIDVLLKKGVTIEKLGIPPAGQYCNPVRPTTIVPAGTRDGKTYRRWEFMRLPGERVEEMEHEARVWELLKPWAGPADIELVRHKVYNFRSLLASKWRDRRFLLAGDAAHVMPPFMGQGMCSGIRDAWNLAWKLDLILDEKAADSLLDSYQAERMPHVSQLIDISIYLGKIICIPDAIKAAERDRSFLDGTAPPPPPFPHLTAGLLHRQKNGSPTQGAGLLSPHVNVKTIKGQGRLDDMLGPGFVLITSTSRASNRLEARTLAVLEDLPIHVLALNDETSASFAIDLNDRLANFLGEQGWDAMIVRPDFYVYGGASGTPALTRLVESLREDLGAGLPAAVFDQTANCKEMLATGTPEGVGVGMTPPTFLKAGDVVRCEIDGIGAIENKAVS